jgi:hypothetical protein
LDLYKGERKTSCKAIGENTLEACLHRLDEENEVTTVVNPVADWSKLSTVDLVQELASRGELIEAVKQVDTDELAGIVKDRGVKLLLDARADDLEGELRRVTDPYRPTIETFYYKEKVKGVPHVTDKPFVKKAKMTHERDSYRTRSKDGAKRYKLRTTAARK